MPCTRILQGLLLSFWLTSAIASPFPKPTLRQSQVFDQYVRIPWKDEMACLDSFAIQIKNTPGVTAYISIINGREFCPGEGQARAVRARDYLIKRGGIPWNRVMWRDWGFSTEFLVALELVPPGYAVYDPFSPRIPASEARPRPDCVKIMKEIRGSKF